MSLATIRLRHAVTHADHTQDLARDRATAALAHTRVAAVVDTHPIIAVDHRLTVGEEALLHTVALEVVIANHTRVPVRTVNQRQICSTKKKERRKTNRRSFCFQG